MHTKNNSLIEMRYKTFIVIIVFSASIFLIWLFHVIIGFISQGIVISPYAAVGGMTETFGPDVAWWATLSLVLVCLCAVEMAVGAIRQRVSGSGCGGDSGKELSQMGTKVWKELERDPRFKSQLQQLMDDEGNSHG